MGQLDDRIVVVTGAGRGLGRAFAAACCEAGGDGGRGRGGRGHRRRDRGGPRGGGPPGRVRAGGHRLSLLGRGPRRPDRPRSRPGGRARQQRRPRDRHRRPDVRGDRRRDLGPGDGGQRPGHLARGARLCRPPPPIAGRADREHRLRHRPVGCAAPPPLRREQGSGDRDDPRPSRASSAATGSRSTRSPRASCGSRPPSTSRASATSGTSRAGRSRARSTRRTWSGRWCSC